MKDQSHTHAHGAHTHTHESAVDPLELFEFYERWLGTEQEIKRLQDVKKKMLSVVRTNHGRHNAEAIRIAMRRLMTDDKQRKEAEIFNSMAAQYVDLVEGEIEARTPEQDWVG